MGVDVLALVHDDITRLFWNGSDAILMVGTDGRVVRCNPASERLFGYAADELTGREVASLIAPVARVALLRGLRRYRTSGACRHLDTQRLLELPALGRRGDSFPVEVTLHSVRRASVNGELAGAGGEAGAKAGATAGEALVCAVVREPASRWGVGRESTRLESALLVARTAAREIESALAAVTARADELARHPNVAGDADLQAQLRAVASSGAEASEWALRLRRIVRLAVDPAAGTNGPDRRDAGGS